MAPTQPDAFLKRHLSISGSFIASDDFALKNSCTLFLISAIKTSCAEIPPPMQNFSILNNS